MVELWAGYQRARKSNATPPVKAFETWADNKGLTEEEKVMIRSESQVLGPGSDDG